MKQTAVEWLINQLIPKDQHEGIIDIIEEAKEMEKQQIIKTRQDIYVTGNLSAEQYYNETFKNK